MKKYFYTLLLGMILLSGCITSQTGSQEGTQNPPQEENSIPSEQTVAPGPITAETNQEFTLSPGQAAGIKGTDLSIYFTNVESDSRCPSDVQCITAGTVQVAVDILKNGDKLPESPFALNLGEKVAISYSETGNPVLEFVKIEPERGKQSEEIPKANYRATFQLKRSTSSAK